MWQTGEIDEEALRAVLASLDMSEFIPHEIRSPTTSDLEDAMVRSSPFDTDHNFPLTRCFRSCLKETL